MQCRSTVSSFSIPFLPPLEIALEFRSAPFEDLPHRVPSMAETPFVAVPRAPRSLSD